MFKKLRRSPVLSHNKPVEEREIEDKAHDAIAESKKQISRARDILENEVKRLDQILIRGR